MNVNNIVLGFIACGISLCLSGWGFVSPAAAATIIVTADQDVVDAPHFNTGGFCGSGTIANLPGTDGKVSLREAIIAANNTPGAKTITFAPSLKDQTIVLTHGSLFLCGGHTTLNGDVNGNETPDVTIDGRAVLPDFDVLDLFSSHNTVKSLHVLAPGVPGVAGIAISPTPAVSTTLMDNTLTHNIVTGGAILVNAGLDVSNPGPAFNGATVKHITVRDNTVSGSPHFGILLNLFGDHHEMTDVTIAKNTVSGNPFGIGAFGGVFNDADPTDNGASDNRLEVTIKDNLVTGNTSPGNPAGIFIVGGDFLSPRNQVSAQLLNNTIRDNTGNGITAVAGVEEGPDNRLTAQIRGNRVENNTGVGIVAFGGLIGTSDAHLDLAITDNTITGNSNPGDTAGISILGGFFSSPNNQVSAQLLNNTITNNNGNGISVGSGLDDSSNNDVAVTIRDNKLEDNAGLGIVTYGAIGALFSPSGDSSGNTLDARIERNTVKNASPFGLWVFGGLGGVNGAQDEVANHNEVNAVVTDNTISGTVGEGMQLAAGSFGEANDNDVDVTVRKNTVCGSTGPNIHAIGGVLGTSPLINTGMGNTLEGEITKNTAAPVVVEDGVLGNTAHVTQSKNVPCP